MIGLDTNVLVRYVMQDDAVQSAKATKLIEALDSVDSFGYVSLVTVVELAWVLGSSYALSRVQVALALEGLVRAKQLRIESADQIIRALRVFKSGKADFADCLIERSADNAGCEKTVTFDVHASKHAGMVLIA